MSYFVINGTKIHYQQSGEGPDVVLIHGLAANRAFWFLHALQALKAHYRVALYDLRGHGYSSMPNRGYTSADMADDLAALMDHLDISRAVLIGHSFGGVIGLQYALRHPGRVQGLVLADSRIHALQPLQRLQDHPRTPSIEDAVIAESDVDWDNEAHVGLRLLEEFARSKLRTGMVDGGSHEFVPFGTNRRGNRAAKHWLTLLETTTARDDVRSSAGLSVDRIGTLHCPVLSIYGERSRCLESCRKLRLELPRCDTIIVPGVGHFHPITRPRYFNDAILDFLDMATSYEGERADCPRQLTAQGQDPDRRELGRSHACWTRVERRVNGERRIPWRRRGWDGQERRRGNRAARYSA